VLPPVVTGAVVMLIGFNLAPVVADIYWPQDQWVALIVTFAVIVMSLAVRGFWAASRSSSAWSSATLLSWVFDRSFGQITSVLRRRRRRGDDHFRVNWDGVGPPTGSASRRTRRRRRRSPAGTPDFSLAFVLLVLPAVIALVAENVGHVKAVAEMTGDDLDPYMGRAIGADGLATVVASSVGGSPTTTYAENIGVMAATRVYSTAAYYVAAVVAILFGLSRSSARSSRRLRAACSAASPSCSTG
jgi:xanthine/uracil permease